MQKLNLGSGKNPKPGYLNVDKVGTPDLVCDLEKFPWPWETDSVDQITMHHVLEHLGETTEVYFGVIRELYRVCCDGAAIEIIVPHHRHDDFVTDPTHVRPITPAGLTMFSQAKNKEWERDNNPRSQLGIRLGVDLELTNTDLALDEPWGTQFRANEITQEAVLEAITRYNNVIKEVRMVVRVVKPAGRE